MREPDPPSLPDTASTSLPSSGKRRYSWRYCNSLHLQAVLAGLVVFISLFTYNQAKFGLNPPPSATGDEPAYDSLGWQLATRGAYQIDRDDPVWSAAYHAAAGDAPDLFTLKPQQLSGPTAYRPPLFPMVIAGTNLAFGRQFWAVRLVNIACLALAIGCSVGFVSHRYSPLAGWCLLFLFLIDIETRLYSRSILAEPLCLVFVTIGICLLALAIENGRQVTSFWGGVCLGLAMLARSLVVLWIPCLIISAFCARRFDHNRGLISTCLIASIGFACVAAPWWIRNCWVLGGFQPLGTHGAVQLAAGYCDPCWENWGMWQFYDDFEPDPILPHVSTQLDWEKETAQLRTKQAFAWMQANPHKLPMLFSMKILTEHWPTHWFDAIAMPLALIGAWLSREKTATRLLIVLIVANALSVGATWSVGGRFLFPLMLAYHGLAAAGAAAITTAVFGKWRMGASIKASRVENSI